MWSESFWSCGLRKNGGIFGGWMGLSLELGMQFGRGGSEERVVRYVVTMAYPMLTI